MTTQQEALRMARKAINEALVWDQCRRYIIPNRIRNPLRNALAALDAVKEPEPICEVSYDHNADGKSCHITEYLPEGTKLYTAPPSEVK